MKKKPYVGIRAKALLAVVLLVLVPSLFLALVTYQIRSEAVSTVENNMLERMDSITGEYLIKLNRNATACIDNYIKGMEIEGKSAGNLVKDYIGREGIDGNVVWGSRNLLEQMNTTMLTGIMNGSIHNEYYDEMISISGKSAVDSALRYFIELPEMDYSTAHVNESAYEAINSVRRSLGDSDAIFYDFLYSVMLPEYREKLDKILPVGALLYHFRETPDMLWSYFASPDGFIVLIPSHADFSPLFNPLVREWYVKATVDGEATWSGEYIDEITKKPMITFSVPVYENGTLLGVIGFDLLLSTLSEKTKEFYSGGRSFAFALSSDGVALTYPNESIIGSSLVSGDAEFNESMREILNNTEGGMHSTLYGEKVFLAYSTVDRVGWKFVNVVYCNDTLKEARKAADSIGNIVEKEIMYIISIIVAVGLIAFVATFFLIDAFVRDLEELTRIADEVSKGNLDVDVEVDAKDEIGELQKAIKRMVNSIKIAMKELEEGEKRGR